MRSFTAKLSEKYDPREAESIGSMVFEHCTGLSKSQQVLQGDQILSQEIQVQINKILKQLLQHVPIQYILKKTHFNELELEIEKGVLIPRPETEELVHWAIESLHIRDPKICDIGTGSGCIALSLKKMVPEAKILATDISKAALDLAKRNAEHLKLKIGLKQLNILDPAEWPEAKFDLLISNPPYIPAGEKSGLSPHIIEQEPEEALLVPEKDPLLFYKALAEFGRSHLNPGGLLMAEFHTPLARELLQLWQSYGYDQIAIRKDIHGRERMIRARKQGCKIED